MSDPVLDGGADPKVIVGDEPTKKDTAFEAIKAEKKALAEKATRLELELGKIQEEKRVKEEDALKQKGEYKNLWEKSEADKKELSEKLAKKEAETLNLRKIDLAMREMGPLAKAEYWNLFDLESIPVDEATKDIDMNILKDKVSVFRTTYPELLKAKGGKLPSGAPSVSEPLTLEKWKALPIDEKRKRQKDVKL